MTKYWIAVASAEHARRGRPGVHGQRGAERDQHVRSREGEQQGAGPGAGAAADPGEHAEGDRGEQRVGGGDGQVECVAAGVEAGAGGEGDPDGAVQEPQAGVAVAQPVHQCARTAHRHPVVSLVPRPDGPTLGHGCLPGVHDTG